MILCCIVAAISCGIPQSVGNGSFHANQYTVGSQVTYHCSHGYHADPGVPMTAVCLEDGGWSNVASAPRCLGSNCYLVFVVVVFQFMQLSHVFFSGLGFNTNFPKKKCELSVFKFMWRIFLGADDRNMV